MAEVFPDNEIMYEDEIPGGAHWSMLMRRGTSLRLMDQQGGANGKILAMRGATRVVVILGEQTATTKRRMAWVV